MRLIDADKLKEIMTDDDCPCRIQDTILGIINLQPTAYDVDEIVQKIEQLRVQYFLTIANTGDKALDVAYEKVYQALDKAIEIVKTGGKTE